MEISETQTLTRNSFDAKTYDTINELEKDGHFKTFQRYADTLFSLMHEQDLDKEEIHKVLNFKGIKQPSKFDERYIKKVISEFFDKRDLAKRVIDKQPLYYDEARVWWYWNFDLTCWKMIDETDILNLVSTLSSANTINSKDKYEILEGLKQEARKNKPEQMRDTWLQFKEEIIDIKSLEQFKATPQFFAVNPIPYALSKDKFMDTPTIDKIFEEWVGKENVKTLYQIIAYNMLPSYPIHRLFCFIGSGSNGKSCFLNLLKKIIGEDNICSTELDTLLNSRFEKAKLHKKLSCIMGETNFNEITKTNIIKQLTGQDLIGGEYKNKGYFHFINYAKILIATNNLPETNDKSEGFGRRWFIIDFPNRFSEKIDILKTIPEQEYEALTLKCCHILQDLLKERQFLNEGSVEERLKRYEDKSNPLGKFITEFCNTNNPDGFIYSYDFDKKFNEWCVENRFRRFSEHTIGRKLKELGMENGRQYADFTGYPVKQIRCWRGIEWKTNKQQDT